MVATKGEQSEKELRTAIFVGCPEYRRTNPSILVALIFSQSSIQLSTLSHQFMNSIISDAD